MKSFTISALIATSRAEMGQKGVDMPKRLPYILAVAKTPGLSAYLASIGKAGGVASGAARRTARKKLEAGTELTDEERLAHERRREQAKKAAEARWAKRRTR